MVAMVSPAGPVSCVDGGPHDGEEELCAMCIMPLDKNDADLIWLPCFHCFHNTGECNLIREWLRKHQCCPICMTRVD